MQLNKIVYVPTHVYISDSDDEGFERNIQDSSDSELSGESDSYSVGNALEDLDFRSLAELTCKEKNYNRKYFAEAVKKCSKLAIKLFLYKEFVPGFCALEEKLMMGRGVSELLVRQELFIRIFKSFIEESAKERECLENFSRVKPCPVTSKLFGTHLYQIVVDDKITYVAEGKLLGEGTCNDVYFAVDLFNAKIRVIRVLKFDEEILLYHLKLEYDLQETILKTNELGQRVIAILARNNKRALLEFAPEGPLSVAIESKLSAKLRREIILSIIESMILFHQMGYVIGDLKSENILLQRKKGTLLVKFADFGGSYNTRLEKPLNVFTPMYAAPEMYLNPETSQKTDNWMLGMLMYEMKYHTDPTNPLDRVPMFAREAMNIHDFNQKCPQSQLKACQSMQSALSHPGSWLDMEDSYDKVIASLLRPFPQDRPRLLEIEEKLRTL